MIVDRSRKRRRASRIIGAWLRRKHFSSTTNFWDALVATAHKRKLHSKLFDTDIMLLRRKPKRRLPPKPHSGSITRRAWQSEEKWQAWRGVRNPWLRKHVRL